jgi:predicted RNA-binding protein with PUA-like domain
MQADPDRISGSQITRENRESKMNYWLMKTEPEVYSIDDLMKEKNQTEHWDGVRNYQARNMMRDDMQKGDKVFFYHSNCKEPGIVGIARIVKTGYPDFTSFYLFLKYY